MSSTPAVHFYEQCGKPMALKFVYNEESLKKQLCVLIIKTKKGRVTPNNQNPLVETLHTD